MATETRAAAYRCGCGEWMHEACEWSGPAADMVVVEFMPPYLRESHRAAGNSGVWPHNGSVRVAVERGHCAEVVMEADGREGWAEIVEGADPAEYADLA